MVVSKINLINKIKDVSGVCVFDPSFFFIIFFLMRQIFYMMRLEKKKIS